MVGDVEGTKVKWMHQASVIVIASIGVAVAAPADDPCPLAVSLLCRFTPIAPDLDGDVNLTKQVPPTDPAAAAPAPLPPSEVCASGCV